jgi:pyruvate/2-oxoglutarate/acetoin dehydrogenase E1 component
MPNMTFAQALNDAHKIEMARDPNIYVAGEDVGVYGGIFGVTAGLLDQFGDNRVKDTPITESAIVGTAVGAAAVGLRPVIELMFVDFIGVALDQLYNQAAKMKYMFGGKAKIPMVMRTSCGAGIGAAAQHSQCLEALFMHLPGLKVAMPSTPYDAKGLLIEAIRDDNPVVSWNIKCFMPSKARFRKENTTSPWVRPTSSAKAKTSPSWRRPIWSIPP